MSEISRMTIAEKKVAVRNHSRKVLYYGVGGVTAGVILSVLLASWLPLILGLILAIVGGWKHLKKVQELTS
ncbi:MAG: hypothetical protein Q3976_04785 [Corynebacterium sp.]|nr:hypothetical protein [Corynebacterium sp.]